MHTVAAGAFVTNSQGQVLLIKSPRYRDRESRAADEGK
jgi:hypothetical protein